MPSAKIKNPNHPPKGSSIKVDPIRKIKDIKAIKKLLHDKPRDLCLFTLGVNTNLGQVTCCGSPLARSDILKLVMSLP
jgi:hypothetical protein